MQNSIQLDVGQENIIFHQNSVSTYKQHNDEIQPKNKIYNTKNYDNKYKEPQQAQSHINTYIPQSNNLQHSNTRKKSSNVYMISNNISKTQLYYPHYDTIQSYFLRCANTMTAKYFLIWVSTLFMALVVLISVIFILSQAVSYFNVLFIQVANETLAQQYLKQFYTTDMAVLYLAIIGFVIVLVDSIIYTLKNSILTEKAKLTILHALFIVAFVSLTIAFFELKGQYSSEIEQLALQSLTSLKCTSRRYPFECLISVSYMSYQKSMRIFCMMFSIFLVIFSTLFHFNSVRQILRKSTYSVEYQNSKVYQNYFDNYKNKIIITQTSLK